MHLRLYGIYKGNMNMKKDKLAILGGKKIIKNKFKPYLTIESEEKKAVLKVLKTGLLSGFSASFKKDFYGGKYVREFEEICKSKFNSKYAVSVNSWTSGLIAAVGAAGIEPGDEVITTPWTMCATATSILHWNAIPVFVDIEKDTFNIDINQIEKKISKRTKAIIAVDIFGQPCDMKAIMKIAKKYNLIVIGDSAQASGTFNKNKSTPSQAHIGGISLNRHKHIQTGEGGVCLTNSKKFYDRMCLIRNHAEAIVDDMEVKDISNMVGYNFRLGEIEAAIGIEQIKKLDSFVDSRRRCAEILNEELKSIREIRTPKVRKNTTHSYYIYPIVLNLDLISVKRSKILRALESEGIQGLSEGYVNIHRYPIFQKKIAYGRKGFPWKSNFTERDIDYSLGICPIAEELHDKSFIAFNNCHYNLTESEIRLIGKAFRKVFSNLSDLK